MSAEAAELTAKLESIIEKWRLKPGYSDEEREEIIADLRARYESLIEAAAS